jgi:hypothetical protein
MTGPQRALTVICTLLGNDTAAAASGLLDQIVAKIPQ